MALKLVADSPLKGRIVDLEGNPIAGVDVSIGGLFTNDRHDLSTWLDALRKGVPFFAYERVRRAMDNICRPNS